MKPDDFGPDSGSASVFLMGYAPAILAWSALVLVLAVGLPLFLRMPLGSDALVYDLCARRLLRGGVLYRDVFENNLPGIIWMQAAARAALGWTPEALRVADFGLVAIAIGLLLRWVPAGGVGAPARGGTAAAVAAFYLFAPEIVHAQRDVWMLLPAVVALVLRNRQMQVLAAGNRTAPVLAWAALEGFVWGVAFWVKPFVTVPALAAWLASAWAAPSGRRMLPVDAAGTLAGGLAAGVLGLNWLAATGAWRSFLDCVFGWNKDYATTTFGGMPRAGWLLLEAVKYLPWSVLSAPAVFTAVAAVGRATAGPAAASRALLGAFYLGWLAQATIIQRPHDYVLAPTFILSIVLVAGSLQSEIRPALRRVVLASFILVVLLVYPGLRPGRVLLWARCWRENGSPELMDRLALNARWLGTADWQDLAHVAGFLRDCRAADGDLICLGGCTHALYLNLDLEPSTRFVQARATARYHPAHAEQVRAELQASRGKHVVSDLADFGRLTYEQAVEIAPGDPLALPPSFPPDLLGIYPWREPLVFRAGRYVVHRARGPVTPFW